jgi:hypothetical protein
MTSFMQIIAQKLTKFNLHKCILVSFIIMYVSFGFLIKINWYKNSSRFLCNWLFYLNKMQTFNCVVCVPWTLISLAGYDLRMLCWLNYCMYVKVPLLCGENVLHKWLVITPISIYKNYDRFVSDIIFKLILDYEPDSFRTKISLRIW